VNYVDEWDPTDCWKPNRTTAVFIDAANFYPSTKRLNLICDYRLLYKLLRDHNDILRIYYYTAIKSEGHVKIKPLLDYLDFNGYTIVTKPSREFTDSAGDTRTKGNMDSHIIVDMLEIANSVDHIILFSGDGDFLYPIEKLKSKGIRVTVVSTLGNGNSESMVSEELRRAADVFIDIKRMKSFIEVQNNNSRHYISSDPEDQPEVTFLRNAS